MTVSIVKMQEWSAKVERCMCTSNVSVIFEHAITNRLINLITKIGKNTLADTSQVSAEYICFMTIV